ncbi:hypothetical protein VNO77_20947 [Canavalia gladiata]|uniref:diaminohydroxyphosphoribosylaminopyrimidine deaminase n=1 Tax=Canavalia gladiata TaxID=3824 RepID=A0AAN9QR24_CANGL
MPADGSSLCQHLCLVQLNHWSCFFIFCSPKTVCKHQDFHSQIAFFPAPRSYIIPTPHKFASFVPTQNPSNLGFNRSLTCGFCKSVVWVHGRSNWRGHCPSSLRVQCGTNGQNDDGFYLRRCVELARKAFGCVIIKAGKIVGEGFNPKAGQPHAEVFAVRDAGDLAENATAFVSLEPCNHFGKTPPCTEALIKAKGKKVVIGMVDPNPIVAHRGVARLRDAGIEVVVGVEEELCRSLNEVYIHHSGIAAPPEMAQQGIEAVGVEQINLNVILDYCNQQGLNSVLLDFRGNFSEFEELIKEGIEKKYCNKFVTEILPVWNGSSKMYPLMPLKSLKKGIEVINLQSKASDQSVVLEGYFKY